MTSIHINSDRGKTHHCFFFLFFLAFFLITWRCQHYIGRGEGEGKRKGFFSFEVLGSSTMERKKRKFELEWCFVYEGWDWLVGRLVGWWMD